MEMYRMKRRFTSQNTALKLKNVRPDLQPPAANRGVGSPERIDDSDGLVKTIEFDDLCRVDYNGMLACIDYLEFTVFDMDYTFVITDVLGLSLTDFSDVGYGAAGYQNMSRAVWGDVRVLHGSKEPERMGVHVTIPGDGCRALFSHIMPSDLIQNILGFNCKVTRLDLALDNIGDIYFYPYEIKQFVFNKQTKSRWRTFELVQSGSIQSAELTGDTFYLGSRTSDLFCRVYDKTLERIYRKDDKEVPEHWVRWELVCKDDRAQVACEQLLSTGFAIGEIISGVLSNYFSILVENPFDSHKDRWPVYDRWQKFIGDVRPIRLFRVLKPERTLDDVENWLVKQCAPSLSAMIQVYGMGWVEKEIGLNSWRINNHLASMVLAKAEEIDLLRQKNKAQFS